MFKGRWWRILGGALLVAGTSVGAGMLSLPVATAEAGFYPAVGLFAVVWIMMLLTALFMLEATLCFQGDVNLISMTGRVLGQRAKRFTWFVYMLFLYSLMAAYTAGGSGLFLHALTPYFKDMGPWLSELCFVGMFAAVVMLGTRIVDYFNRFLMISLIAAFFGLVYHVAPEVNTAHFSHVAPNYTIIALPLLVTAFGFHLLIPSLTTYLDRSPRDLRLAIVLGSAIPLVIYLAWEWTILGTIPLSGEGGLRAMLNHGDPVVPLTEYIESRMPHTSVFAFIGGFGFFALTSSFIGVALGLYDFLADGFHIQKNTRGRLLLGALTFLPPLAFVWVYPHGFMLALGYAGVFASILLVLMPSVLVYWRRYRHRMESRYQVSGGPLVPIVGMLFGFMVILVEICMQFGILRS